MLHEWDMVKKRYLKRKRGVKEWYGVIISLNIKEDFENYKKTYVNLNSNFQIIFFEFLDWYVVYVHALFFEISFIDNYYYKIEIKENPFKIF